MARAGFLESYVFGPLGFWTMAALQNLIPSFPWIVPPTLYPGAIQGKEGIKFCHLATVFDDDGDDPIYIGRFDRLGNVAAFALAWSVCHATRSPQSPHDAPSASPRVGPSDMNTGCPIRSET